MAKSKPAQLLYLPMYTISNWRMECGFCVIQIRTSYVLQYRLGLGLIIQAYSCWSSCCCHQCEDCFHLPFFPSSSIFPISLCCWCNRRTIAMEKYENLGMIGEGSYGMVMKCRHRVSGANCRLGWQSLCAWLSRTKPPHPPTLPLSQSLSFPVPCLCLCLSVSLDGMLSSPLYCTRLRINYVQTWLYVHGELYDTY